MQREYASQPRDGKLAGLYAQQLRSDPGQQNGGAKDHVVNGEMSGGYGLIACPAEYGRAGIMTFMVNQDGVVYESDLGEETTKAASALKAFNPDAAWAEVKVPSS